ncbi:MAG: TRAP transporter permease, partial [Bdellovibrionales bacterium]|nr:TRAP transporter permease [Bdellovibrionales bacterium]
ILAAGAALYLAIDYEGIGARAGLPNDRDLIIGLALIVLLIESARRALGLALPVIATLFILYSFFSESMPEIIAFQNASLSKVVAKLVMGGEGIFGVPLDVSASTVFLFVLFGTMLEKAGGGKYFIDLAFSILGPYRGGPAKAAVLASGLTGMVSGSSIANTVTTGTFTIPLMKKAGFPGYKAAAVEVAASTNGQLMPPIMGAAAFIIAEYCNLDYFDVVKAAVVPALASYVALIYITHLESLKLNIPPTPRSELPKFWPTLVGGLHYLVPLGFLIYQLVIEQRSASLSAFYATVALMVLMILMDLKSAFDKKRSWAGAIKKWFCDVGESLVSGGRNMMTIGVAVAAAGIIVGIVTLGLGGVITDLIEVVSGGNLIFMLIITAIVSLLLGMGLPTTANYIVMASLTAPTIVALSTDMGLEVPLIAAHLFCFYFGILADDTPPVGLAAYAAGAIAKEDPIKVGVQGFRYDMRTAILPFMFIFNTDLLLVGVDSWSEAIWIFLTTIAAMFAFASMTQRWLIKKCSWIETFGLLASSLILFRPSLFVQLIEMSRDQWRGVGLVLFALIYLQQHFRVKANPA